MHEVCDDYVQYGTPEVATTLSMQDWQWARFFICWRANSNLEEAFAATGALPWYISKMNFRLPLSCSSLLFVSLIWICKCVQDAPVASCTKQLQRAARKTENTDIRYFLVGGAAWADPYCSNLIKIYKKKSSAWWNTCCLLIWRHLILETFVSASPPFWRCFILSAVYLSSNYFVMVDMQMMQSLTLF